MSAVEEFPSQEPSQENVGKSDADGERKAEADVSPSEPQTGVDKEPTGQFAKFQFLTTEQGSAQVPSQVPAAGQQLPKINQDFGVAQTPAATEPTAGIATPVQTAKPAEESTRTGLLGQEIFSLIFSQKWLSLSECITQQETRCWQSLS